MPTLMAILASVFLSKGTYKKQSTNRVKPSGLTLILLMSIMFLEELWEILIALPKQYMNFAKPSESILTLLKRTVILVYFFVNKAT